MFLLQIISYDILNDMVNSKIRIGSPWKALEKVSLKYVDIIIYINSLCQEKSANVKSAIEF
jgi:hypothetical protein